jgi:dipeptidyl-peptidase-4
MRMLIRLSLRHSLRQSLIIMTLLALLLSFPGSLAQGGDQSKKVTRANYELASRFTADRLRSMFSDITVRPVWIDGGERFWYAIRKGTVFKFFMVGVKERSKSEVAVDLDLVGPSLVEFTIAGRMYRFDTVTQQLSRIYPDRPRYETWETPSPDGKLVAYARNHNLVVKEAGNPGEEKQVTLDGQPFYSFAESSDPFYAGEADRIGDSLRAAQVLWAPDSRKLVIIRKDVRHFSDNFVTNSLGSPAPELITYKQRFPGGEMPGTEVWIYDSLTDSLLEIEADKWSPSVYEHIVWARDSNCLYMVRKSPDHLKGELLKVGAATGAVDVLITEDMDALVLTRPVVLLPENAGFLWWSRRDGYGHYYLYDSAGSLRHQVTSGEFNAAQALAVDKERRLLFFMANGRERRRNPYYEHLYSVDLSGRNIRLLTYEDSHHEVYISPSHDHFVDNFSRVDEPPRAVLRDIEGGLLIELEAADVSRLVEADWKEPEVVKVKAADGKTDLWGVMWKPYDFDPGRKYPIISFVYAGPQDELVPLTFMSALDNNAHLAQYGFIVVQAGNRGGSYKRSLEYSEYYRGNLRDYPVADNKAVIEELARRYEWIDIERVGIWGGSSGAYAALTGMLTYPEFYKVCVARSGPHDPNIYHAWWSDQFQGMERAVSQDGAVGWLTEVAKGNLELAGDLKGRLLLVHSELDSNVHPAHSARMAKALMAANKRFDYFIVPGAGHGWGQNWAYVQRMMWTYFVHYLMGDARWSVDIFEDFDD